MCGIAGIANWKNDKLKEVAQRMSGSLGHRGPDAEGFFYEEDFGLALGHRRLSILDLSEAANQPLEDKSGRYCMIYNGEVYNFKELAKSYDLELRTNTDSEVVIELFARLGPACLDLFNGMFCLAIYDKENKSLFLARDRFGIKPLYYSFFDGKLFFASELKALKTGQLPISYDKDEEAIAYYLHWGFIPEPHSIYKSIKKFPAAHWGMFEIAKGEFQLKRYWDLNSKLGLKKARSEKEAKQELLELLQSSVKYRLLSDVPVGTFLSGGTDSSIVTALAQKVSTKPIETFSIGFKENKFNEAEYAAKVADYLGTKHTEFILSHSDAAKEIPSMVSLFDEPFADSSAIPTKLVSRLARDKVTVALSGDGGDELFLGYGSYTWAERLSNPLISLFRKPVSSLLKRFGSDRLKRGADVLDAPQGKMMHSHILSQEAYLFSRSELNKLGFESCNYLRASDWQKGLHHELNAMERQAAFDMHCYLRDDLLVKVDRASMAHSLEVRVPILDHRVVEFAGTLQYDFKRRNRISKYLLKEVLYDLLPRELMERPKQGFGLPLIDWFQNDLRDWLEDSLDSKYIKEAGLVNLKEVEQLKRRFFKEGESYLYNRLWAIAVLHQWEK